MAILLSSVAVMATTASAAGQETTSVRNAQTETADTTSRLRDEQRAYMGRNVRVHLKDGSTTRGRLIGETSEGLAVQPSPSDEPVLVPYDQIESIAAGMPRWQKIALGAGAAGAVVLAAMLN